ncbi:hypothetical protein ABKN59_005112 [Abortiporus biennis]
MAPSNLQGLNIVHPPTPQNPYLSDQDLLSVQHFPDLTAQLDLWTNLNFQSDEPLSAPRDGDEKRKGDKDEAHAHENVVTGTVLPPNNNQSIPNFHNIPLQPPLDIASILAGFGIDPFQVPPPPVQNAPSPSPSLAQLLSYHAASSMRSPQSAVPSTPQTSSPQESSISSSSPVTSTVVPPPKRARTARNSISAPSEQSSPESPLSPDSDEKFSGTPLNAAEDKRRRNTAASARFRLKKKEREAALEKKAKELEVRVSAGAVQQQASVSVSGTKRGREDEFSGTV